MYVRGTFKFYSGEIAGNSAKRGAGVYVYNANDETAGSLYMNGGSVKNNTASDKGGGIYADNLSAVSLFGGEISGNTALTFGGGVCCNTAITVGGGIQVKNNTSGAVGRKVTDNVYLRTTGKADYSPLINISTLTQEASIGVGSDTAAPVTISDSCDDVTDCFTADDPGEQIVYEDGVLKLAKVPDKCKYEQQVETPVDGGTYRLTLNGREQGRFEFAEKDGGWSIRIAEEEDQANGKEKRPDYLAAKDGKLILSDEPYFWTYDRKTGFSTAQIAATQIPGFWFLFWHIPASTTVTSAACYLNTTQDGEKLAVCPVCTGLYQKMAAPEHECEWVDCGDGQHKRVCVHCETEFECEGHDFGEDGVCTRCGAKECDLTVTYSQTRQTVYGWFWTRYTVYTVKISVTGSDRESVTKVEFSLDGGKTWHAGRTITSNAEIGSLLVRVTDKHGARVFELPESK